MMRRNYGGIIWTNHALNRLTERGIKQGDAWSTFNRPDQSKYSSEKGAWVYNRTWEYIDSRGKKRREIIEIVAKQNEKKEWIVLSIWSKPIRQNFRSENKSLWTRFLKMFEF